MRGEFGVGVNYTLLYNVYINWYRTRIRRGGTLSYVFIIKTKAYTTIPWHDHGIRLSWSFTLNILSLFFFR